MPTYGWILIILGIVLAWFLWNKYGGIYKAINANPAAVHAGLSVNRYVTDIEGLLGAFEGANDQGGSFTSRLGAFFGALPS